MRAFTILLRKDCQLLWRSKSLVIGIFGFALLLVILSSFAFLGLGMTEAQKLQITPGILWLIFAFSSVLCLNQSFLSEKENKAFISILLSPVSPNALYLAKWLSNTLFIFLLQLSVIFLFDIFFGVNVLSNFLYVAVVVLLAASAFSAIGTLLSAMSVHVRSRELILPIILFPLCLPLFSGAIILTQEVLQSGVLNFGSFWFWFLICANTIPLALSLLLFEFVVRD